MKLIFLAIIGFYVIASLQLNTGCITIRKESKINSAEVNQKSVPLLAGRINESVIELKFMTEPVHEPLEIEKIEMAFSNQTSAGDIEIEAFYAEKNNKGLAVRFGKMVSVNRNLVFTDSRKIGEGMHMMVFNLKPAENADLLSKIELESIRLVFSNHPEVTVKPVLKKVLRIGNVVRAAGQDNCHTYRIPGLITTGNGTLIAVYDNRYNNSKDLQEDIDVGMSRSTDGGQTWEPMRVIMDMGEWGGRSERLNGIGDPCVLYDHTTHTIWVAGLWMSGATEKDMLWWVSKPGLEPHETGQFILVKSTDDGITWSEPINITSQVKDPSWQLLLQGPGKGITLADGTLVFPAQFKADIGIKALDGGRHTAHSTIIYSRDGGITWETGTGAKPNTTEAQVVQLTDGSLMLNMRDDLNRTVKDENNGRAVAVTSDFGLTWNVHPSSNSVLPEPNCMASLIATDVEIDGIKQQVLLFSNPNNKDSRTNLTIKASVDGGHNWPEEYWVELNESAGFGYSCLSMVDAITVGILYEGVKELFFQKILLEDILKKNLKQQ